MKAVKTFCSRMHFSLGAGCSAAAGPVGRVLEADVRAGDRGTGMCYTYSCSKGNFGVFFSSFNWIVVYVMASTSFNLYMHGHIHVCVISYHVSIQTIAFKFNSFNI